MATNLNVERIASKPSAATIFTVPQPPEIPATVRTVQEMRLWYNTEVPAWWSRFQAVLKSQLDNLRSTE